MRVLFTIAHYFNPIGNFNRKEFGQSVLYESLGVDPENRIEGLRSMIWQLRLGFGEEQKYSHAAEAPFIRPANDRYVTHLDIVVCCLPNYELTGCLGLPPRFFEVRHVDCPPLMIGFECQEVLKERFGDYDIYAYAEDDIIFYDALHFQKVRWFSETFGEHRVLLPNRYEAMMYRGPDKLYGYTPLDFCITGLNKETLSHSVLGQDVHFQATGDLHSGCFAVTAPQMERWLNSGTYLDRDTRLVSPLESAASLGIAKNFQVFKPAFENASFLEVRHYTAKFGAEENNYMP